MIIIWCFGVWFIFTMQTSLSLSLFLSPPPESNRMLNRKNHHIEIRYGFKPKRAQSTTAATKLKDTGKETVRNTRAQLSTKTAQDETHTHKKRSTVYTHAPHRANIILMMIFIIGDLCRLLSSFLLLWISCSICILFSLFTRDETIREYNKRSTHKDPTKRQWKQQLNKAKWQRQRNKK